MSELYDCSECGERCDPKGTPHECPGSPRDRLDELEARVAALEHVIAILLPCPSQPRPGMFTDEACLAGKVPRHEPGEYGSCIHCTLDLTMPEAFPLPRRG